MYIGETLPLSWGEKHKFSSHFRDKERDTRKFEQTDKFAQDFSAELEGFKVFD